MVRAGALYFAIVIAFFIAIISSSLIMLAAHYRNSYLKERRYSRLMNNLGSSIVYALAGPKPQEEERIDLYHTETDSAQIIHMNWGIYGLVALKT